MPSPKSFPWNRKTGFRAETSRIATRTNTRTCICIFLCLQKTERAAWRLKCATFNSRLSHKNRQNDPLVRCLCVRFEHCKSFEDPANECEREDGQCAFSKIVLSHLHPRQTPPPALIYATRVPRQPAYGAPAFPSIWGKARSREKREIREKREKTGSWQPLQDTSAPGSRSRLGRNHPRLGVSPTLFVFNRGTVPLNHRHIIISHYYFINVPLRVHFHFYWPGKMQSLLLKLKLFLL